MQNVALSKKVYMNVTVDERYVASKACDGNNETSAFIKSNDDVACIVLDLALKFDIHHVYLYAEGVCFSC